MKHSLFATAAIVLSLSLGFGFGAGLLSAADIQTETPATQARAFYAALRQDRVEGLPTPRQMQRLAPFLTDELASAFAQARAEQEKFIKAHADEKPPWIEGDLFSSLFEGVQTWEIQDEKITGDTAEVKVSLSHKDDKATVKWMDTLVLKKTPKGWQVDDIRMGGEWAFKPGGNTLRQTLSQKP